MQTTTTRRAILAGLAAAPIVALPGIADAAAIVSDPGAEKPLATAEEFAVQEFEPFPADVLATTEPPSDEKWAEICLVHLFFLRAAWWTLHDTKPKLIDRLRKIDDETGEALFQGFKEAIEFHKQAADLLEKAELRMIVAGSWLEVNGWGES